MANLDRYEEAELYYNEAYEIIVRDIPGSIFHAQILNGLGSLSHLKYNLYDAERKYRESLALLRELKVDHLTVIGVLQNLGEIARERGDMLAASMRYKEALSLVEEAAPGTLIEASLLGLLGTAELGWGDLSASRITTEERRAQLERSMGFFAQAVRIFESEGDTSSMRRYLGNMGIVATLLGNSNKGVDYLERALKIGGGVAVNDLETATILRNLGVAELYENRLKEAENHLSQSLIVTERLMPNSKATSSTLYSLALVQQRLNEPQKALELFSESLSRIEAQIRTLGGSQETDIAFRAEHRFMYHAYIDLLISGDHPEKALLTLERSRAQNLLLMMNERQLFDIAKVPTISRAKMNRIITDYDLAYSEISKINPEENSAEFSLLSNKINELRKQYNELIGQVIKNSPEYLDIWKPQHIGSDRIREFIDLDTIILYYSIGPDACYVITINKESMRLHEISLDAHILHGDVRSLRQLIYDSASKRHPMRKEHREKMMATASKLYDALIGIVEDVIRDSKRILIVADGSLHQLPWGALIRNFDRSGIPQYLSEWKPLHTVISATLYAKLLERRPEVTSEGLNKARLAAFGNPIYPEIRTPRVPPGDILDVSVVTTLTRANELISLPHTQVEVEKVASFFAGRSQVLM